VALLKNITNAYGSETSYWRIVSVSVDYVSNTGKATLLGYINEAVRRSGKSHIDARSFTWEVGENPFIDKGYDVKDLENKDLENKVTGHIYGLNEKNPRELAYAAIKAKKATEIQDGREVIIDSEFLTAGDVW